MNRRKFLFCTAVTTAFAQSALLSADSLPKKRSLKKGWMMNTFPEGKNLSCLYKFKILKDAGFDGAEPPSHLDQKEILSARDASGIAISSVTAGTHTRSMSSPNAAIRKKASEDLMQALRDAKAYGASSVLCVPGRVDAEISYADNYKRTHEAIKAAVPLAEELGVKIAIENVWNNFLLSPLEVARYVDEFNSPAVGWHFDIGNVMCLGWPEQWIRILGKRIQKLHIKEFSRKATTQHGQRKGFSVEYLQGDNDWPAVMKAIDDIEYHGWAVVEPACAECKQKLEPEAYVRKVSAELDKILAS